MLLWLIGIHDCTNPTREAILEDNSSVMIERDNAEALKEEFDMGIQS